MRVAILGLAATLAACSGGAGAKLSVSAKVAPGTAGATAGGGGTAASIAIGDHVTLERARFLIRKVALEAEGETTGTATTPSPSGPSSTVTSSADGGTPTGSGDGGTGSGGADDTSSGETVVRWGPLVIDLSGSQLTGGIALLFDQAVPAGTYDELKFQIHKLTPGESVSDPDFTPLGSSIILNLTVDGQPFTFSSDLTATSEIEGPFTVADGANVNVTVTVDPSGWFTGPDGAYLDPRLDANRTQIEQNLRGSIRGFEDDDHDGQPDAH